MIDLLGGELIVSEVKMLWPREQESRCSLMRLGSLLVAGLFLCLLVPLVHAQEERPRFRLLYAGSFKKITRERNAEGVLELAPAIQAPHTYAVGLLKNAEGEFTVLDNVVSLNYGKDSNRTIRLLPKGELAALFIGAQVEAWSSITIPSDMTQKELTTFVLEQARKSGLNTKDPFPFLVRGTVANMVWSVPDGTDLQPVARKNQLLFRKLVGFSERASVTLLGFFLADLQSELAYPGEHLHVHVLFDTEGNTGHVTVFSVLKGSRLEIPR